MRGLPDATASSTDATAGTERDASDDRAETDGPTLSDGADARPPGPAGSDAADDFDSGNRSDAAADAAGPHSAVDGGVVAWPFAMSAAIGLPDGGELRGAEGDGLPLAVVLSMSDGTKVFAPSSDVNWTSPETLVAQDPYDAAVDVYPDATGNPLAFYVSNDARTTNHGVLFIASAGATADAAVNVTATLTDGAVIFAAVAVFPVQPGDASSGAYLFQTMVRCADCHGNTAQGSPVARYEDGGPELAPDGGPLYAVEDGIYPYPAPGLNAAPDSGNLAVDPSWNAVTFSIAAQAGVDNHGVSLRNPMPVWFGGTSGYGRPLSGQDFADMYAWLRTQTQ